MFFALLWPRVGFIHLSQVSSFSKNVAASILCLYFWELCLQGVRSSFHWRNTFSDASLWQPPSYIAVVGRTRLSCWSPHREISHLKGVYVCVWFVHQHLSLHLLSFCTFLLSESAWFQTKLLRNTCDGLLSHSFKSSKNSKQGCLIS